MRHDIRTRVYTLGFMILLSLIVGCDKKFSRKKTLFTYESSFNDVFMNDEPMASETSTSFVWPKCAEPEMATEDKTITSDSHLWRKQAENVKNAITSQVVHDGLTQERSVQLALVNNPELFAIYENLSVAHADILEAGLRENPAFKSEVRYPEDSPMNPQWEYEATSNFLDYFLIPFRERAAIAELEVTESEIAERVIDLVRDVQLSWLDVKRLEQTLINEYRRVEVKELAAKLSSLQRKAGNISALEEQERVLSYQKAKGMLYGLEAELSHAREKLNRHLGLFGEEACWNIAPAIDWHHDIVLPAPHVLEELAIARRPDIEVIRREINALAHKAELKQWWTYSNLRVGVTAEHETDGTTSMGPVIELELPIYNYGQAEQQKYFALIAQAQKRLLAKAIEASSEVRAFFHAAELYSKLLNELETTVLPGFAEQMKTATAHYHAMTLGTYDLFDLKEDALEASLEHTKAWHDYFAARIELLHAVGGSFVPPGGAL